MKLLIFSLALLAVSYAAVLPSKDKPENESHNIVKHEHIDNYNGDYHHHFETSSGIFASHQGTLKNRGTDNEIQEIRGSYKYTSPDGTVIEVNFVADELGFQPQGTHLPTPPPIPVEIQRALDYLATAVPPQVVGSSSDIV